MVKEEKEEVEKEVIEVCRRGEEEDEDDDEEEGKKEREDKKGGVRESNGPTLSSKRLRSITVFNTLLTMCVMYTHLLRKQ